MLSRNKISAFFACSLFLNAFCAPVERLRFKKSSVDVNIDVPEESEDVPLPISRGDVEDTEAIFGNNDIPSSSTSTQINNHAPDNTPVIVDLPTSTQAPQEPSKREPIHIPLPEDDDDDDDDFEPMEPSNTTNGGSNLISLLNIATALFPGSNSNNVWIRNVIKYLVNNNFNANLLNPLSFGLLRRQDVSINEIELDDSDSKSSQTGEDYSTAETSEESIENRSKSVENDKKKNEIDNNESSESEAESDSTSSSEESDEIEGKSDEKDKNNAAEESVEVKSIEVNKNSKQLSESNGDAMSNENNGPTSDSDYDSDEPPGGGDGEGGGILGLLAGLSGGEDGQSDLGSLLATVGGIVANLSGDGIDLNSLIASGLGLFVGLLSEGNENPGSVVASYLLTSLDTITGGGANNNGEFFGTFVSKLLKGISAVEEDSDEEGAGGSDSAGFFGSLLMGLLGNMSKGSSHPSK